MQRRLRLRVSGVVQGVGFRPFVARLATQLQLTGFVRNSTSAVVIEIEGPTPSISTFVQRLETDLPPAATIDHIDQQDLALQSCPSFAIVESEQGGEHTVGLPPDLAICPDCQREQDDPGDRRYRYPFLNCTHCGPRYSIVQDLPYDRPRTTMRAFPLCEACAEEYHNPSDRRYHAQPIACPVCGPSLSTPIEDALSAIAKGQVLAVRGIGGFHLACDARNPEAVGLLRQRKARGDQPFAMMVRDLATAALFVELDDQSKLLLASPAAPIVLLPKRNPCPVGDSLAPRNGYLGIMLAYSPLHRLLLQPPFDALVMTSGNRHGEPIATSNEQALQDLAPLADTFLLHNRDIVAPADDSVVRLWQGKLLAIRRGRGYAPQQLRLPIETPPALAVGAELKAAFALGQGRRLHISPHIGDMENLATLSAMEHTLKHLSHLYAIKPEFIFHDAHPGYLSTQWSQRQSKSLRIRAIQHHRAHVASVMAEYGLGPDQQVTAVVFDGTGYGDDGAIWGGEFFTGTLLNLQRTHHLPYIQMPGGDLAAKRPALSAIAHLQAASIDWQSTSSAESLTPEERRIFARQIDRNLNCHPTSSIGRLFDAASSLLGIRHRAAFEAQAAIEMESLSTNDESPYHASPWHLEQLWEELLSDAANTSVRAGRFHQTIAHWTATAIAELAQSDKVILGGGVFQNVLLLATLHSKLQCLGFEVFAPRYLPPNDGGLSVGQMYLGALLESERAPNSAN